MKKLLKKFAFSFFAFLLVFSAILPNLSFTKVRAAGIEDLWIHQWYGETNPFSWYAKVYDTSNPNEIFGERYTAAQVQWVTYSVFSMFWNLIPGNPGLTLCLTQGNLNDCAKTIITGLETALGITMSNNNQNLAMSVANTIGQSPISGVVYFKDMLGRFSLISPVKAQGVGYTTAGQSILGLWRVTRNISYSLIVIAVIVLAFMIMFRVKISPQVVITIQSAIPKLIIALILITFSYAIAGLLIDFMYVVIGILATFIHSGGLSTEAATNLFSDFTNGKYSAVGLMYLYWIHFLFASLVSIFVNGWGGIWGVFIFLFAIIAIFAIIWWSIKIIWELVKNFAMIMLTIVIGPLEIMMGTVTGSVSFGGWLKRLVSYLAVYPVMILLFFFSFFFLHQGGSGPQATLNMPFTPTADFIGSNTWIPPLSVLTVGSSQLIWVMVSFFIFSQITKVSKLVQSFIAGKPFEYGSAIGEVVGGARVVGEGAGELNRAQATGRIKPLPKSLQELLNKIAYLSSLPKTR